MGAKAVEPAVFQVWRQRIGHPPVADGERIQVKVEHERRPIGRSVDPAHDAVARILDRQPLHPCQTDGPEMFVGPIRDLVLLIGDGGVGKSAFRRAWLGEIFQTQYLMTLGADFASKHISLIYTPTETEYIIKYQIWDLAGQPRFKVVSDLYYRGAVGALCFFDITNQESFINLEGWIQSYWNLNGQGKRPLIIVGAKSDLRNDPSFTELVSPEHGIDYAKYLTEIVQQDNNFIVHYIETSAKENINVDKTFRLLGTEIIKSVKFKRKFE